MIDTTAGTVISGDWTVSGHATEYTTLDLQRVWPPASPFLFETEFENADATANLLTFLFPPVSLVGYSGGILCGISTTCTDPTNQFFSNIGTLSGGFVTDFIDLDHGSLEATTLEPSSEAILLMAPALVGFGIRRAVANNKEA